MPNPILQRYHTLPGGPDVMLREDLERLAHTTLWGTHEIRLTGALCTMIIGLSMVVATMASLTFGS